MNLVWPASFYAGGAVAWLVHVVITSVVNGLIFSVIFRLVSHLSTSEAILLVAVVIGGLFLWARARDRGW